MGFDHGIGLDSARASSLSAGPGFETLTALKARFRDPVDLGAPLIKQVRDLRMHFERVSSAA